MRQWFTEEGAIDMLQKEVWAYFPCCALKSAQDEVKYNTLTAGERLERDLMCLSVDTNNINHNRRKGNYSVSCPKYLEHFLGAHPEVWRELRYVMHMYTEVS